jgi:hypothetical protein
LSFDWPAATDNIAGKTIVQTLRASFPPRTLAEIAGIQSNTREGGFLMRNSYRSRLFILSSALIIFIFNFIGCAPVEIKKVTAQKADYYKFTSQKAGLIISVDLYREEDRLKEFFGCDLLSRGVLPVLLVIENQNAEDGYILVKEKTGLIMEKTNSTKTEDKLEKEGYTSDELEQAIKTKAGIDNINALVFTGSLPFYAVGAIASPIIVIGIVPMLIAEKKVKDEYAIKRNIEETQLVDKTLYQGSSNSGFLYFQLNDKEDINKIEGILLSMKNIRSKEITSLIIKID